MTTTSSDDEARSPTRRDLASLAVLVIATVAVYYRVIDFDLIYAWDDGLYVLHRPEVKDWFAVSWRKRLLTPELGYPVALPTFLY